MGTKSLELQVLRRIPAKYKKDPDKIYREVPAGLEQAYCEAEELDDPWHVKLIVRNHYCTMEQIKAYLTENHPGLVLTPGWAMSGGYHGNDVKVTDHEGTVVTIPNEIYEGLKTGHDDRGTYEIVEEAWSIDLTGNQAEWLEAAMPCYIDTKIIKKLADGRIRFARKSTDADLIDRISEAGYTGISKPDIIGILADGLEHARRTRCALRARIVS